MLRKPLAVLAATAFLLGAAGLALARGGAPNSLAPVSATFDAATVSHLRSSSCTGEDGTYTRTRATYTGTATGDDARWDGALTVRALSVYNTDTNLGYVVGRYRVATESAPTVGWFQAVNTNGTLTGFTDAFARGSRCMDARESLGELRLGHGLHQRPVRRRQLERGRRPRCRALRRHPRPGRRCLVFTVKGKHGNGKHHMKGRRGGR